MTTDGMSPAVSDEQSRAIAGLSGLAANVRTGADLDALIQAALAEARADERRRIEQRVRSIPRSRAVNGAEWDHVQVDAVEDAIWDRRAL